MDLSTLVADTLTASSIATDLLLVGPQTNIGIATKTEYLFEQGFKFDINGDEGINLLSDITDHYVEDNTSIQDHWAIRPITYTVSGYVGELNNVVPPAFQIVKDSVDRLQVLAPYTPTLAASALRAYNTTQQLFNAAANVLQAGISSAAASAGLQFNNKQQDAFAIFHNYWKNRILLYVQTPYVILKDMAIMSIRITQADGNKNVSDFEMTFKQIRTAKTLLAEKSTSALVQGGTVNKGKVSPGVL